MYERFRSNPVDWINNEELWMLKFPNIQKYKDIVEHGFSTRLGGVSQGKKATLNLGFGREDDDIVLENYKRVARTLNIPYEDMVLSKQVHGSEVRVVTAKDKGKGIIIESDLGEFDAIITAESNLPIVTFYADCVPVLFFHPQNKVIASAHSGWRSTVQNIAGKVLKKMKDEFECNPSEIQIAVGPSIKTCCFEIGNGVYDEFNKSFSFISEVSNKNESGKWMISLQSTIKRCLIDGGAKDENINMADICTRCNSDIFYSYRAEKEKTGSLAAFMMLR